MTGLRATYRLQLHAGFGFADAATVVPYFAALGISHLYLSPILAARAGSMHGYDGVDPTRVSPALGGEDGLRSLAAASRAAGLGLIVDIVPNHMAVGRENPWWQDVLAHGAASAWAGFFDIDWATEDPALRGRILCPFLDRPYGAALGQGMLVLGRDPVHGFAVRHHDQVFPIAPADHAWIAAESPAAFDTAAAIGRARLHALLERQHYRLAWWRAAGDQVNWRRFFDIGELAGLRVEDAGVFDRVHATVLRLYREGTIDGLRIDHVDGLADPAAYLRHLRDRLAALQPDRPASAPPGPAYIVVEKILADGEALPADWPVAGTTGYDFMDEVSAVMHDPAGEPVLTQFWAEASGSRAGFEAEAARARREIVDRSFAGQIEAAAAAFDRIARADPGARDTPRPAIRRALAALLAHFPTYRTYAAEGEWSATDAVVLARAIDGARGDLPAGDHETLRRIGAWLADVDRARAGHALRRVAAVRLQQLSAPVAAKGVEDTAFYRYGRLLSRNDVGFAPGRFALTADAFHDRQRRRRRDWPRAMLATATHDHKRGEDVRARLAVLSEIAGEWRAAAGPLLARRPATLAGGDALMLLQTLVGAWPLDGGADALAGFAGRVAAWQVKALREAKQATDWIAPDEAYERTARSYLDFLLRDAAARAALEGIVRRVAPAGAVNGLAQMLLRLTVPGVPDTYQGTERWDLSLVDPDNRRPVDFAAHAAALVGTAPIAALAQEWRDGRIKQAVLARTLAFRADRPGLFAEGGYEPIAIAGPRADRLVAFLRRLDDVAVAVIVPCRAAALLDGSGIVIDREVWSDTRLVLPRCRVMAEVVTGRALDDVAPGRLAVASALADLPVALVALEGLA